MDWNILSHFVNQQESLTELLQFKDELTTTEFMHLNECLDKLELITNKHFDRKGWYEEE